MSEKQSLSDDKNKDYFFRLQVSLGLVFLVLYLVGMFNARSMLKLVLHIIGRQKQKDPTNNHNLLKHDMLRVSSPHLGRRRQPGQIRHQPPVAHVDVAHRQRLHGGKRRRRLVIIATHPQPGFPDMPHALFSLLLIYRRQGLCYVPHYNLPVDCATHNNL